MTIQDEIVYLNEFLRKAEDIISPDTYETTLKHFGDGEKIKQMQSKHPKCWIPINVGQPVPLLVPICNMHGTTDPRVIQFSLKFVDRLVNKGKCKRKSVEHIIKKLQRLYSMTNKECPSSYKIASSKGNITKSFNCMKKQVDKYRGI